MGKRNRRRKQEEPRAEPGEFRDEEGNVLVLRGSLTPATRREYDGVLHDQARSTEDSWQRAVEFLFERLAVRWEISGVATEGQRELLARYRAASQEERRFVRDSVRAHVADRFPEVEAP